MFGNKKKREDAPRTSAPQGAPSPPASVDPTPSTPEDSGPAPLLPGPDGIGKEARKLNLVGSSQLTRAVAEAVRRGLDRHFDFDEGQLGQAVEAIGHELLARLKANSRSVRGLPKDAFLREVREDKRRIEAQREAARKELEALLEQLGSSQGEWDRQQAELVAASQATGEVEDRALSARIAQIFSSVSDSDAGDLAALKEQITSLALGSVQGERDKLIEAQMAEHQAEIDKFQRRITKLTGSLEMTEDELRRIASSKNIEIGLGSIYRTVQGLSTEDNDYETKKELMSSIFAANLELQKGTAEAS